MKSLTVVALLLLLSTFSAFAAAKGPSIAPADEKILLGLLTSWGAFQGADTWIAGSPCANWNYITCDAKTGRVTKLAVGDSGLSLLAGVPLPASIGGLTALTYLDLNSAGFTGTPPSALGSLTLLQYLDLSSSAFTGPFPAFVSQLKKLVTLNLAYNKFKGPLPASYPPALANIYVHFNLLSGPVPDALAKVPSLRSVSLDGNAFTSIPAGFGSHPSLTSLSFEFNVVTILPDTFSKKSSLTALDFGGNLLKTLPASLCTLPKLQELSASANKFSGQLPICLAGLRNLNYLSLGNNSFSGVIPPSYGVLPNLGTLDLSNNKLTGPVPDSFGYLTRLTSFHVEFNQLSGVFPVSTQSWKNIADFNVAGNKFTGPLPQFPKAPAVSITANDNYFTGSPLVNVFGRLLCAAAAPDPIVIGGNCLTVDPTCKIPTTKSVADCNKFCGTLSATGQCASKGVCLYANSGPYCACSAGYKQPAKNVASCVKA